MNPIKFIAERAFAKPLRDAGPALTIARLCTSRHLEDLQVVALLMVIINFVSVLVVIEFRNEVKGNVLPVAGAVVAASAAALNWAYQKGSKRIGTVDLFACEISVICRVGLVVDFARSSVDRVTRILDTSSAQHTGPAESTSGLMTARSTELPSRFTSEEQYTPVYDNQLSDLVPLDVDVVTHVTEFYTYRKTMIDYLRAMASSTEMNGLRELSSQMVYMQYLMYESARLAIFDLVEFDPNRAESVINILCSEIPLYCYLMHRYKNDYRGKRLELRLKEYGLIVAKLDQDTTASAKHKSWQRAIATMPELLERYNIMCNQKLGALSASLGTSVNSPPRTSSGS